MNTKCAILLMSVYTSGLKVGKTTWENGEPLFGFCEVCPKCFKYACDCERMA